MKALIFGTGKSGISAADLLSAQGYGLVVYDGNKKMTESTLREKAPVFKEAEVFCGELPQEVLEGVDLAVLSPGVPVDGPEAVRIKEAGIPMIGELELGFRYGKGRTLAITGTNGKTTTTALTGALLSQAYPDVRILGNIGNPYADETATMTEETWTVLECSSFQLETIDRFHPRAAAILNLTPDHLDRHHTAEAYYAAKKRVAENMGPEEPVVLNREDPELFAWGQTLSQRVLWFSSAREVADGLFVRDGWIHTVEAGVSEPLIAVSELQIPGVHNQENAMAAAALALSAGVPREKVVEGLRSFQAVAHRIQFVEEKNGVRYYDDSKGTNPDAAIKGILAMDRPTVVIGGGYDKDADYTDWIRSCKGRAKALVLYGATREKIRSACDAVGFADYTVREDFREAFRVAAELAQPGDAVLLSPACASWDQFKSFEERGDLFQSMVREING